VTCLFVSTTTPRVVANQHDDACSDDNCRGCLACPYAHCRVCGKAHTLGTCPECLAVVRANLHDLAARCGALPDEVKHRGINGEAMMLLGPSVDPEALGHVQASIAAGRLPADYLEVADHELHPLFVLGREDMIWRDALEHSEPEAVVTIASAVAYLDRQLTYMASFPHVPFEDFATALRDSLAHLANVLHDENQGDLANVGCFDCGGDLERRLTERDGFEDWWTCRGCRRRYTHAEYNFALRAKLEGTSA
jgi:hypothetical protein